jgi:hypothetical protein
MSTRTTSYWHDIHLVTRIAFAVLGTFLVFPITLLPGVAAKSWSEDPVHFLLGASFVVVLFLLGVGLLFLSFRGLPVWLINGDFEEFRLSGFNRRAILRFLPNIFWAAGTISFAADGELLLAALLLYFLYEEGEISSKLSIPERCNRLSMTYLVLRSIFSTGFLLSLPVLLIWTENLAGSLISPLAGLFLCTILLKWRIQSIVDRESRDPGSDPALSAA